MWVSEKGWQSLRRDFQKQVNQEIWAMKRELRQLRFSMAAQRKQLHQQKQALQKLRQTVRTNAAKEIVDNLLDALKDNPIRNTRNI